MTRLLTATVAIVLGLALITSSSYASQFDPDHPNVSVIRQPMADPWDVEKLGDGDPWDEIMRVGPHGDDGGWGGTERQPTGDDVPWNDQSVAPRPGWHIMLDWLRGLITVGGSY